MSTLAPSSLFPPQLHVFVRDWLSSNNILLRDDKDGHVLIDSGYTRHAELTLALLASKRGIGDGRLASIVNTHCHADHVGGNAAIVRRYGCDVVVPEGEAPLVDRWDGKLLLYDYCAQRIERFSVDRTMATDSIHVWGGLEWQALAAPGHDMGALVFYNPEHRILVSGDAFWEDGFGFLMPHEIDPEALAAARATIDMLARLDIAVVIPGHGDPFTKLGPAFERAYRRLDAFAQDSVRVARHALKVNLMFALLDEQRMPLASLPEYIASVGIYRDVNALYFRLQARELADLLVGELERADAIERGDGWIVPTGR